MSLSFGLTLEKFCFLMVINFNLFPRKLPLYNYSVRHMRNSLYFINNSEIQILSPRDELIPGNMNWPWALYISILNCVTSSEKPIGSLYFWMFKHFAERLVAEIQNYNTFRLMWRYKQAQTVVLYISEYGRVFLSSLHSIFWSKCIIRISAHMYARLAKINCIRFWIEFIFPDLT